MQYPYLTLLSIISIILKFLIGTIVFYLIIKRWKEIKFLRALKAILLYELTSLFVYLIYPHSLFLNIFYNNISRILDLLAYSIVLFLIFYLIMKKFFLISIKKFLIVFLLVFIITFPFLSFFHDISIVQILKLSFFSEEKIKLENQINEYQAPLILGTDRLPMSLEIIGEINSGMFSWPGERARKIIIYWQ